MFPGSSARPLFGIMAGFKLGGPWDLVTTYNWDYNPTYNWGKPHSGGL